LRVNLLDASHHGQARVNRKAAFAYFNSPFVNQLFALLHALIAAADQSRALV
jgi:hypothetical protein